MPLDSGTRRLTMKDVARAAAVSPSVVSRILNNDASLRVREETRARVLQVIEEMDYSANSMARSLRLSRTNVFELVIHDLTNPIYAKIVEGAFEACSEAGYSMVLTDADQLNRDLSRFNAILRGRQVDGILLLRSSVTSDTQLAALAASSVPTVLLMDSAGPGISTVSIDDKRSVYCGVKHLLDLGHRRIAHLTGLRSWRSDNRHQGYLNAMRQAGIEPEPAWVGIGGWTAAEGREGMNRLAAAHRRTTLAPTAVFVSNTLAALGVLDAARKLGISVPGTLSVASLHDTWLADLMTPSLTTVQTPLADLGRRAVKILIEQQQSRVDVNTVVATCPVVIQRQSTASPLP